MRGIARSTCSRSRGSTCRQISAFASGKQGRSEASQVSNASYLWFAGEGSGGALHQVMAASPRLSHRRAALHILAPLVALAVFAVALLLLRHELRQYGYHQIVAAAHAVPLADILAAVLLTAL